MPLITEVKDIREAVNIQRFWRRSDREGLATGDPTERFRPITIPDPFGKRISNTDIPELNQKAMQEVALFLYQTNPLARRWIELSRDYVVGSGVTLTADREDVLEAIQAFWLHPDNAMDERLPLLVTDVGIYGEILLVLSFAPNGLMRVSYVSASYIEEVKPDPNDLGKMREVVLEEGFVSKGSRKLNLLRLDKNGFRTGDAIILQINKAADATRGLSDLLTLADVLGNLDLFLFNSVERAGHMMSWFWDILYQGATQEQLDDYVRQIYEEGTYPGQIRIHNEKVTWEAKTPNLQSVDTERLFNTLFSYFVTGAGIPPHWTGVGGGVIRAGAEAAQEPAYKRLVTRQSQVKRFLEELLSYQVDHLIRTKKLPKGPYKIDVIMPQIAVRDLQRLGGAFARVVQALTQARDAGLLSDDEAKELFNQVAKVALGGR